MRHPCALVLLSSVALAAALAAACRPAPPVRPRLVVISVDGLMPSSYTSADSNMPTLRALAARGAWAERVTGVWPTNTHPSHTSLATGVRPVDHGIFNNAIVDPESLSRGASTWYARDIKAPTLIGAATAAGYSTAAINWPVSVGLPATYLVATYQRTNHPETLSAVRALSTPGLLDDFERDAGRTLAWPPTDTDRADLAKFIIRTHHPDLILLYFGGLDDDQHEQGPGTPIALETMRRIDGLIASVLASVEREESEGRGATFIAIMSDHGAVPIVQGVSPNAAFREADLIGTDGSGRITRWQAFSQGTGGMSYVYLKDPRDSAAAAQTREVLQRLQADPRNGVERIMVQQDLAAVGGDPRASFAVITRLGYSLNEFTDTVLGPAYVLGGHGYPPTHPEMSSSFIMAGPGVDGLGNLGVIRLTQIAPTLARLLGVPLAPKADAPIDRLAEVVAPR